MTKKLWYNVLGFEFNREGAVLTHGPGSTHGEVRNMEEVKTKKCSICGETKPLSEFAKKSGRKDGTSYCCTLCNRKRHKTWYQDNKEEIKQERDDRREEIREYDKQIYEKNRDSVRARQKVYYEENSEQVMNQQREALKDNPAKGLLKLAKQRVKSSGWELTITEEDIIVPEFCPVFGVRLEFGRMDDRDNSPSLDRIDSTKGYIPGNVAVICWAANKLKSNGTAEEHRRIADWMDAQKVNWNKDLGETTEVDDTVWKNAGPAKLIYAVRDFGLGVWTNTSSTEKELVTA